MGRGLGPEQHKAVKRAVHAVSAAILGHTAMDVVIHSYPIFSLLWWVRTSFLAAAFYIQIEAMYWWHWSTNGNGNGKPPV
jgi:hypothetical protein